MKTKDYLKDYKYEYKLYIHIYTYKLSNSNLKGLSCYRLENKSFCFVKKQTVTILVNLGYMFYIMTIQNSYAICE